MFKMDDIKDAFLEDDSVKYVNIPKASFSQYRLKIDDILFNRVNSEEFVGRTGIIKTDREFVFASYLIRLRVNKSKKINPDYLNIFLNSYFGLKQIRRYRRRAVNQANVNAEELKEMKIAVLSENHQEQIRDLSNRTWNKRMLSRKYYQEAELLLLRELGLSNFEPKDDLCWNVNSSEIDNTGRADAEYFQPKYRQLITKLKKTKARQLGDLVSMAKGIEPGSDAYQEEGKSFIRVSSLSKFGIKSRDQKFLSDTLYKTLSGNYRPAVGEILLTKDASPGISYVIKEPIEGIISGGILRLKVSPGLDPEYLAICLNSLVGQMQVERDAGGSIISHWKLNQIESLLVPILPLSTQQKIADLVKKSHQARKRSKELLEEAKRKVEEMIEKSAN